jgi:phosphoribosyl 1,2-cyclic phosphodiesterase
MQLKVISSDSSGNGYILESDQEALIIECGVRFDLVKRALNFKMRKVVGCLITHSHKDHCKGAKEAIANGIDIYTSSGTLIELDLEYNHRAHVLVEQYPHAIGSFKVIPFLVKHNTAEPFGFMINHPECGNVLFLTDTMYSPVKFKNLNNIIVEANYCEEILADQFEKGQNPVHRSHVLEGHLSIQNCKELLKANDLSRVNNIVLIHLSNANSDALRFQKEVQELTGKTVWIADKGMTMPFDKTPF